MKGNEVEPFVPLNDRDMAALEVVNELQFLLFLPGKGLMFRT